MRLVQTILGVAAIACFATAMHFMHKAGCAGDLKSGLGNTNLALSLEGQRTAWGTASALVLALLAASFPGRSVLARAGIAVGAGVLGYIVLIAGAVQVESAAIRSCF
jgi:hypothetical protein